MKRPPHFSDGPVIIIKKTYKENLFFISLNKVFPLNTRVPTSVIQLTIRHTFQRTVSSLLKNTITTIHEIRPVAKALIKLIMPSLFLSKSVMKKFRPRIQISGIGITASSTGNHNELTISTMIPESAIRVNTPAAL